MNRIYRLVWSRPRRMLVPVAEWAHAHAKDGVKRGGRRGALCRTLPVAALLLLPGFVFAAPPEGVAATRAAVQDALAASAPASKLPTGGSVVAGQATLGRSGQTLTVRQSTPKAILDWQSFDIGAGYGVAFLQPDASSIALNRVTGGSASSIFGRLDATGQVFLVNPNGVLFAPGAEVHTAGLVASTLGISNADFLSGKYRFSGAGTGSVTNLGNITVTPGGYVAFIGRHVANDGSILAPGGSAALGAGGGVDLTLAGNSLLSFRVSSATLAALAENGGLINAGGGRVILSARAKDALMDTVVNNTGIVRVVTAREHAGSIELLGGDAGTVRVAGTLDASAPAGGAGGFIETSGAHLKAADDARITTHSANGTSGHWLIDPVDFTIAAAGGDITGSALSAALGSGSVTIQTADSAASCTGATCGAGSAGAGDIRVNDTVAWSANTLTLDAWRNIDINTAMQGSGTAGLALKYGQGAADGIINGTPADYHVNAPVNLASTGSFSTQLGTGGAVTSYTIITSLGAQGSTTGTDLQGIGGNATTLAGNYVLGANIDASATSGWNGGAGFAPIGKSSNVFKGSFGGLGHTISNLTINRPSQNNVALFAYATSPSIRDLGLPGTKVTGKHIVGTLIGSNLGASVNNVYASGSVQAYYYAGGLVGSNSGAIINSYAAVDVAASDGAAGGIAGLNSRTIDNVYAVGSISAATYVGGLVGLNNGFGSPSITNSYATGAVSGSSNVGGLVGRNSGTVTDSYWDLTTSGQLAASGGGTPTSATGLSTAQLASTLPTGFDPTLWANAGNQTTPYLIAHSAFGTVSGAVILGSDASATPKVYGVITTLDQLQNINTSGLAGSYVLGNDIDATATATWNGGLGFTPIGNSSVKFTGVLDGLGHHTSGLTINRPASINTGLFGSTSNSAILRNLALSNVSVAGGSYTGGLVGSADTTTIEATSVSGTVSGGSYVGGVAGRANQGTVTNTDAATSVTGSSSNTGGLVGYASGTTVANTAATGSVSGYQNVGGLAGDLEYGASISSSYASGSVSAANNSVGGLAGKTYRASISTSYATGGVSGASGGTPSMAGGLVGQNYRSSITGSYATGNVSGSDAVGGLVGSNTTSATISGSYATGTVTATGNNIGGLAGRNNSNSSVNTSYAYGDVSGKWFVGGLVGFSSGGSIASSYATGDVNASSDVGGLLGEFTGGTAVTDSYATGSVTATAGGNAGGLLGTAWGGTITNSYASGAVTSMVGGSTGGLIGGWYSSGSVATSYWNITTTGQTDAIGANAVTGATGLDTSQMQHAANFPGFDFTGTWVIYEGHTAPLLRAFMTPLTVTAADRTAAYTGTTSALAGATYSVAGADTSGHLFGLTDPYAGARNVGSYAADLWSDQQGYVITLSGGGLTINPLAVTLTAPSVVKTYDQGTAYTTTAGDLATLSGALVGGDTVTAATIAYADKSAGAGNKTVTLASAAIDDGNGGANYAVTLAGNSTSTIDPVALTLSGLTVADKTADGSTAGRITADGSLGGVLAGDTVTLDGSHASATFASAAAGTHGVDVTGLALAGADAGNYALADPQTTTATIHPAPSTGGGGTGGGTGGTGGTGNQPEPPAPPAPPPPPPPTPPIVPPPPPPPGPPPPEPPPPPVLPAPAPAPDRVAVVGIANATLQAGSPDAVSGASPSLAVQPRDDSTPDDDAPTGVKLSVHHGGANAPAASCASSGAIDPYAAHPGALCTMPANKSPTGSGR